MAGENDFQAPSFLDNPLVGAIGKAMAMSSPNGPVGSVIAAATPPPQIAPMKPPVQPSRTEEIRDSMDVRQRYNNRPQTPARGLGPGVGMSLPGMMSPEMLMHPEVQKLLGQYGITPSSLQDTANNASPNLFVTNPEAYEKHPVLAGMLERGLEGAAFTQGSKTWGEGISNVAQGMLNARGARADKYNNQLMMPFAQAEQVAHLKGINLQQQFEQAQSDRDEALVKHYGDMDATREELNDIKNRQVDLADRMGRFHQNASLIGELQKTPLDADEQKKIDDATTAAGGDPYNVDPKIYTDVYSSAAQRKIDEDHKAALQRAQAAASSHVASSDDADERARMARLHQDAAHDVDTTQKALNDFDSQMTDAKGGTYVDDSTGTTYTQGSPDAVKYRATLMQRLQAAKDKRDHIAMLKTPGSGMSGGANPPIAGHFTSDGRYVSH